MAVLTFILIFRLWYGVNHISLDKETDLVEKAQKVERAKKGDDFFYYFAYASDLSQERLREGSSSEALTLGVASLSGYRFDYTSFSKVWKGGVADIVPTGAKSDKVWGVLYRVPKGDLDKLDKQKGINKPDPRYRKFKTIVDLSVSDDVDGYDTTKQYEVVTYCITDNKRGDETVKPSQQYRKCILKGSRQSGLPRSYTKYLSDIKDNGSTYRRKSVGTACD